MLVLALLQSVLGADFRIWNSGEPVSSSIRGIRIRGKQSLGILEGLL